MIRYAKMTNLTRSTMRPPLWIRPESTLLLAELQRSYASRHRQGKSKQAFAQARQEQQAPNQPKPAAVSAQQGKPAQNGASGKAHVQGQRAQPGAGKNGTIPQPARPSWNANSGKSQPVQSPLPTVPANGKGPRSADSSAGQNGKTNGFYRSNQSEMPPARKSNEPANGANSTGQAPGQSKPVSPQVPARNGQSAVNHTPVQNSPGPNTRPANGHTSTRLPVRGPLDGAPARTHPVNGSSSTGPSNLLKTPVSLPKKTEGQENLPIQVPLDPPAVEKNGTGPVKNGSLSPNRVPPTNGASRVQPAVPGANGKTATTGEHGSRPFSPPAARQPAASLEQILELHPELPLETALLGVCRDGLPVLLDLNDPAPGALLLVGDERENHLQILRSAVASTVKRNSPHSVQFLVLTDDPNNWRAWVRKQGYERYCIAVEKADSDAAHEWILRMADWTEQRRMGQRSGPSVLLAMDTLDFLPRLPYDVRLNFEWLVKEAPPARIWPIGSITTNLALSLGTRMLKPFQSRILGYACDPVVYTRLGDIDGGQAESFANPGEFAIKLGEDWLRFQATK